MSSSPPAQQRDSMMLNLSWSRRDHLNADVLDSDSGQTLFHLETPFELFGSHVTTMTDAQGQIVAEYERRLGHDRVTYKGETHRVSDWLPLDGIFTTTRQLRAPDGNTYLWKEKYGAKFKLVDERSDAAVARTHAANLGILSDQHNITIEAGPEVVAFLDLVVLSFIICESERQSRQRSHRRRAAAFN